MSAQEQHPNDPNRGMNTKVYMISVLVAIIAIILVVFFLLARGGTKEVPKANQPNPNSRLILPLGSLPAPIA